MNICTAAVRGGTEKSLSDMCKSKKQRHCFHSRPCPSEARSWAESMQGRGSCCGWCQDLRVSFCTAWDTCTLPGEGKIFSLCLDSFAPRSSRAPRTCMVNSNALCYLSPSLSCPTVGLQPVTWPCGTRMRESMLTLQHWELWAHGSMKIASALALGAKENSASPRGTRQPHSHWPDRGTLHGIRLSTLNWYTYW